MIHKSELRVGNKILNCDNEVVTVTEIRDEFYLNDNGAGQHYTTSNPISVSPEIFKICGFKKENGENKYGHVYLTKTKYILREVDFKTGAYTKEEDSDMGGRWNFLTIRTGFQYVG